MKKSLQAEGTAGPGLVITRRGLLTGAGAVATGVVLGRSLARGDAPLFPPGSGALLNPRTLTPFLDALPDPPLWTTAQLASNGLVMAPGEHEFHTELGPTPTWGYGGAPYLSPVVEAQRGVPVTYVARNELGPHLLRVDTNLDGAVPGDMTDPRAAVHLHGGYTPESSDGLPTDTITPSGAGPSKPNHVGNTWQYTYPVDQQSGSIWFHDHALGITRLNVYLGLAGFFPIRDAFDTGQPGGPLGLAGVPAARGGRELLLVLQDKSFTRPLPRGPHRLYYPYPWVPEFFGDVPVITGKAWPQRDVGAAVYRLRIANGSTARFYNLRVDSSVVALYQIGTDSGLLPAPVAITDETPLVLAPGERADVLIDFRAAAGATVHLVDAPLPPPVANPAPGPFGPIVRFRVGTSVDAAGIPTALRPVVRLPAGAPVAAVRHVTLVEVLQGSQPVYVLLDNLFFSSPASQHEHPRANTLELWNIINTTADTHPIHLHLVQFQIAERQPFDAARYRQRVYGGRRIVPSAAGTGPYPPPAVLEGEYTGPPRPPAANELGWKDTVQAHPGEVTRIWVPFGFAAAPGVPFGETTTFTGQYVWHCHMLDHEDNEMMLPYEVVP